MAHSGIIGTGSESWCESQALGAVSCSSAWLSLLSPVTSCISFCSPKKTLGEGSAPRHEEYYKNRFGLGCPALLSFPLANRSGRCGTLPLDSLVLGFIIFCFVVLFVQVHQRNPVEEGEKGLNGTMPCGIRRLPARTKPPIPTPTLVTKDWWGQEEGASVPCSGPPRKGWA